MVARPMIRRDSLERLIALTGQLSLISTDVFDTLLLRNSRSEPDRIARGEKMFSNLLAQRGISISHDVLTDVRVQAQRLAFQALSLRGSEGEVRLAEIVSRQLYILGLPQSLINDRLHIEIEVEKTSLVANRWLASVLKAHQRAGARIIAISDTTLSAIDVDELIRHFHGADLIDHVYSSADFGLTKRDGGLFDAVAEAENVPLQRMVHIGDDARADLHIPTGKKIDAHHTPRPVYHRYFRAANRGSLAARRYFAIARAARTPARLLDDATSFGRSVFGPITTQFAMRIWLYAAEAETENKTVLLFCARGGIGIRETFERILEKLQLPLNARRENVMISRLIAARAAILAKSEAAAEELDREFRSNSFDEVAAALGGQRYELPAAWHAPFDGKTFLALLFGASGEKVLADIQTQNALFASHFKQLAGDAERIILVDTGLYGSTQRLLAHGFPGMSIETVQFARSNYKGHGEEHFPRVTGLIVQQSFYSPANPFSSVLRYWHLIESLYEPAVPSVRSFAKTPDGQVIGNCGPIDYGAIDPAVGNPLLTGALAYINELDDRGGAVALSDAKAAWRRLKAAVTRPTNDDLKCLAVDARSVDFGRVQVIEVFKTENQSFRARLSSLKSQLWREGAIAQNFPVLKHVLLPMLGAVQSLRGVVVRLR